MPRPKEKATNRYLQKLAHALRKAPRAIKRDALQDAEEFLRSEVTSLTAYYQTISERQAYDYLVDQFGSPEDVAAEYFQPAETEPPRVCSSSNWRPILTSALLIIGIVANACFAIFREPPKLSPFTDVVIEDKQVLVEFDGKTREWIAIDEIPVEKIIVSAQKQFGSKWEKRIIEDLVEVLWGMGHVPRETVSLRLRDLKTKEIFVVDKAQMTRAKRQIVYSARHRRLEQQATQVADDPIPFVQKELQKRWAYYPRTPQEIEKALIDLQDKIDTKPKVKLAWELQKVIAQGIDGHASVRGWRFSGRRLPFLIEPMGDRYVAFFPDRSNFVDPDHPFIESIDGIGMDEWCNTTATLVPNGSRQFVKRHALRHLRAIGHWREELDMELKEKIQVRLTSRDGERSLKKMLATADRQPIYGSWPRKRSDLLENNIGYLRLESMNRRAETEILRYMDKFADTQGLIVDVRGNGGGSRAALRLLFSYLMSDDDQPRVANCAKYRLHPDFSDSHLEARYMYRADSPQWTPAEKAAIAAFKKSFRPQWQPPEAGFSEWHYLVLNRLDNSAVYHYTKPVVVLMDAKCFSATDIFLAGLKGWRNVTLVGTPSGGGSARKVSFELPGTPIEISVASMASFQPDGKLYDGNGITPDVLIEPTPGYFLGEEDTALEAAQKLIASDE